MILMRNISAGMHQAIFVRTCYLIFALKYFKYLTQTHLLIFFCCACHDTIMGQVTNSDLLKMPTYISEMMLQKSVQNQEGKTPRTGSKEEMCYFLYFIQFIVHLHFFI